MYKCMLHKILYTIRGAGFALLSGGMTRILARVAQTRRRRVEFAAFCCFRYFSRTHTHIHSRSTSLSLNLRSSSVCTLSLVPLPCPRCLLLCVCCIEYPLASVTDYGRFNGTIYVHMVHIVDLYTYAHEYIALALTAIVQCC